MPVHVRMGFEGKFLGDLCVSAQCVRGVGGKKKKKSFLLVETWQQGQLQD